MPKLCSGISERVPCIFAQKKIGQPARPFSGEKCLFCHPEKMTEACDTAGGRKNITRSLKFFRSHYESHSNVYNSAMMLVPEEWREKFHEAALKPKRSKPARPRKAPCSKQSETAGKAWETALASRKRAFQSLNSKEVTAYKKRRTADRNRVAKKFFLDNQLPLPEANDIAKNDAGLPAASFSDRAAFVEQWCKFGSWGICKGCHSLQPRNLEPLDTRRVAPAEITAKACKQCKDGKEWVPQPHEIPRPLRKLSLKLSKVLRPLDIDVGPERRAPNGYRHHVKMIRFSWCEQSVQEKIAQAGERSRRKRERLQAAYDYLMTKEAESSYRDFVKDHKKFLRRHPDPSDEDRRRPLQYLETVGIECALWPTLYWCTEMTETLERATDVRRLLREGGDRAVLNDDSDEETPGERHSVKRSFARKVLGPIVGYSQAFELLQFVYDLAMWSRIGGGKNACAGLPLRLVLRGETFSPLYWKEKHQALIDMQRQCGFPALFRTMAPWEFSFPYHAFVLDEMAKCGKGRMQAPCFETLHTAHVFTEINRGLYTGMNKTAKVGGWKNHILAAEDGQTKTVVNYFQRLEFQDGKRKLPTQHYHGSGRVHVHSLDYLQNVDRIGLERKMSATVPSAEEIAEMVLRGYMLGRPHGRSDSGWPVEAGASRWDPETALVKLRHTEEDKD
eukprot:s1844_g20.t1